MSPAWSSVTLCLFAPELTYNCASRSLEPLSALTNSSPAFSVPLITLKYWTSPIWGSMPVLKKNTEVGCDASVGTSLPSLLHTAGISLANGTTLLRNSIMRSTPMFCLAHTRNNGKMLRVTNPLRIPSRISSCVSSPWSKNFSISASSCSAAASIRARFISVALSSWSAGISSIVACPPSLAL